MTNVHFVGSIGLDTVDEVFEETGRLLGKYLKRVPDGEPGGRRMWTSWQYPLLRSYGFLRADPSGAVRPTTKFPLLCLAEGATAKDVSFGEFGYAREARASYEIVPDLRCNRPCQRVGNPSASRSITETRRPRPAENRAPGARPPLRRAGRP